ncbi:replication initiation protein [Shewanella sp. WXL01]|uniref:penicillin-insensitive murein endopeptidase n=1 Tax=Shewanella sp. WXL01 TaxID=2709721 RepID=UPI001438281E|nr:penicillin-insensitive murein endopeptidase [Shewanella sp. WXL01]NKF50725.1 replication initiation protein [Shewanella sp. WXL01]
MTRTLLVLLSIVCFNANAKESVCYGTTSNGRLENGVELPAKGDNYVTYSYAARLAGRTYVHSKVRDVIVSSYAHLYQQHPNKVFKYAETGFESGGRFRPHKTHRNGLSVDFMTPVIDNKGNSVHLPTNVFNKLGYNIEFDANDQYDGLMIDYDAMAAHIVSLHKAALANEIEIWRVIFDPQLQPHLFKTRYANYLKQHITFSKKRSWVRHDEHYHVDFSVPCKN